MRLAVPIWGDRLSPVFDVARRLLLVEAENGRVTSRMEHDLGSADRVKVVAQLGVDLLICGAVSLPLERRLVAAGVGVMANVCGSVEEVIHGVVTGTLLEDRFSMPGCSHRSTGRTADDLRGRKLPVPSAGPTGIRSRDHPRGRRLGADPDRPPTVHSRGTHR